jgi:uncharacterized protein (DUF1778 family)
MGAQLAHRSVNSFIVNSALEKAEALIQAHDAIALSDRDRDLFFAAIQRPPKFNAALKAALALHERVVEKHGR